MVFLSKRYGTEIDSKEEIETDILQPGRLLLSKGSVVMIDETELQEGIICEAGVSNLRV